MSDDAAELGAQLALRDSQLSQAAAYGAQLLEENAALRGELEALRASVAAAAGKQAESILAGRGGAYDDDDSGAGSGSGGPRGGGGGSTENLLDGPGFLRRSRGNTQRMVEETELRAQNEALAARADSGARALAEAVDGRAAAERQVSLLQAEIESVRDELETAERKSAESGRALESAQEDVLNLRAQLAPLMDIESERDQARESAAEATAESQKLQAVLEELEDAKRQAQDLEGRLRAAEDMAERAEQLEEENHLLLEQQRETHEFLDQARVAAQQLREEMDDKANQGVAGSLADDLLDLGDEADSLGAELAEAEAVTEQPAVPSPATPEKSTVDLDAEAARKQKLLDELNQKLFYAECTIKGLDLTMEQLNDQLRSGATRQGYLLKRGTAGVWKRKFFFLKADRMYYCASPSSEFEGMMLLGRASVTRAAAERKGLFDSMFGSASPGAAHKWLFQIETPERNFMLEAASQQDRDAWITDIQTKIQTLQEVQALEMARRDAQRLAARTRADSRPRGRTRVQSHRPTPVDQRAMKNGGEKSGEAETAAGGADSASPSANSTPKKQTWLRTSEEDIRIEAAAEKSRESSSFQPPDPLGGKQAALRSTSPPPSPSMTNNRDRQLTPIFGNSNSMVPLFPDEPAEGPLDSAEAPGRPLDLGDISRLVQHSDDDGDD